MRKLYFKYRFTSEPVVWIGTVLLTIQSVIASTKYSPHMMVLNIFIGLSATIITRTMVIPKKNAIVPSDVVEALSSPSPPQALDDMSLPPRILK